ncbi:hypothetical protein SAMN05519103_09445 [Rhizobiales bacterium GAS113]|nr:hypothetical protein SAMN05519103_09445 [Rhizobiales bacterium GAS113]
MTFRSLFGDVPLGDSSVADVTIFMVSEEFFRR